MTDDKFWSRVAKSRTCWIWTGAKSKDGYGLVHSPLMKTHRKSWKLKYGEIPKGMMVCHKCDNPLCVRPSHLFLGTAKDNVQDMQRKGRRASRKGERHPMSKLTDAQTISLREEAAQLIGKDGRERLAQKYGISYSHLNSILRKSRRAA